MGRPGARRARGEESIGSRRAIVTGAAGFIGSHLVPALLGEGWQPLCLLRPGRDPGVLARPGVEVRHCELNNDAGLSCYLRGAEVVFHLAGAIKAHDDLGYWQGNHATARALGEALASQGANGARLVAVSSLAAGGPWALMPGRAETMPDEPVSAYGRSKLAGEKALLEALPARQLIILRPPVTFGPGDRALLPFFRAASRGLIAVLAGLPQPFSYMQVDDLVRAICLAGHEKAPPGRYYVSGGAVSGWPELGQTLGRVMGRCCRVLPFPPAAMGLVCRVNKLCSRLTGRASMLNPDKYMEAKQPGWLCDGSLFEGRFGFRPECSLEEGLAKTVRGYRDLGWL